MSGLESFPELAAVVAAMAGNDLHTETSDVHAGFESTVPDTTLTARLPGAAVQNDNH